MSTRNGDIPSTSEYTGVLYVNKGIHGKWKATIKHQGRKIVLGIFDREEDAARAFDRAAVKYRGAGARTNFPIMDYSTELSGWTPEAKDSSLPAQQQPAKRARTSSSSEERHLVLPTAGLLDQTPLIASANFKPKAPVTDVRPTPINARGANPALDAVQSAISNVMQEPLEKFMGDATNTVNQRQQRALDWCRSQIFASQQALPGSESPSEDKAAAEQLHLQQHQQHHQHEQHQHEQHQPSTPSQHSPPKQQLGGPVVATLRVGADGQRKFRGVSWVAEKGKWRAQLSGIPGQKKMHLGYFATAEEAAAAYDAAAFTALGNSAHLNFRPPNSLISASAAPAAAFTIGSPQPPASGPRPRGRPRKNPELAPAGGSPLQPVAPGMGMAPQQHQQPLPHHALPKEPGVAGAGVGAGTQPKKSKYLGVSQMKSGAYLATMKDRAGNKVRLGMFFTEEEAARAYDNAVLAARGSGAKTNFHDYGDPTKAKPPAPARTPGPRTRRAAAAAANAAAPGAGMGNADMAAVAHAVPPAAFSNGFASSLPMQAHGSQPLLHPHHHHPQQLHHQPHQPAGAVQHNAMQPQPVIYMPQQPQAAAPTTSQTAQVAVGVAMAGPHMHSPSAVAPTYTYTGPVATAASAFTPLDGAVYGYSTDAPVATAAAANHAQYSAAPLAYAGAAYAPAPQPMQQQYAAGRAASGTAYSGQWPYWGRS